MIPNDDQGGISGKLDEAIAVLGQLNALIPIGFLLGKSLVDLVQGAIAKGNVPQATKEEALAAIASFQTASADVRQTAEEWLDAHPPTDV